MATSESVRGQTTSVVTAFGEVTGNRVTFYSKKGLLGGGRREDIPVRHVTSVSIGSFRRIKQGLIVLIAAIVLFAIAKPVTIIIGILLLLVALLLLWGSVVVTLNTAGGDFRPAKGWPWMRGEAHRFAEAVTAELFREDRG